MKELKGRQKAIYEYVKDSTDKRGYPPTVKEICNEVGLASTSTVQGHLQRLERKGYLRRDPSKPRALEILDPLNVKKQMKTLKIVSKITPGMDFLSEENIEDVFPICIDYLNNKNPGELFIFRMNNDSMINAKIYKGDLLIIKLHKTAFNDEIIFTIIDDKPVLARFSLEKDHVRLAFENHLYESIKLEEVDIIGKLVGLYRIN